MALSLGFKLTPFSSTNQVVEKLKNGERLPEPQCCPSNVYSIVMRRCWAENPYERIKFEEARDNLICVSFFTKELKVLPIGHLCILVLSSLFAFHKVINTKSVLTL